MKTTTLIGLFVVTTLTVVCALAISWNDVPELDLCQMASDDAMYNNSGQIDRFIVYGDSRTNHEIHAQVFNQIERCNPNFVIHTGDMVEAGSKEDFGAFKQIAMSSNITLYPCVGNHEYSDENGLYWYFKTFPDFQDYYHFNHHNITFIVLNTNSFDEIQFEWLNSTIADSRGSKIIVIGHHPLFTLRNRQSPLDTSAMHQLFKQSDVYAYIAGHEHYYYKTTRDGVIYIISGGGGAPLHTPNGYRAKEGDEYAGVYHFLLFTVTDDGINIEVIKL